MIDIYDTFMWYGMIDIIYDKIWCVMVRYDT